MGRFRTTFKYLLILSFLGLFTTDPINAAVGDWNLSWAHERSRLPPDKRVLWGKMPNGLRYAILEHPGVPDRVAMKLLVLTGSIEETDEELGIAHFIEHMAFNGTEHFKAGELASFFQLLGMELGHDVNAFTTFDHTIYGLEFWESNEALLRKGLLFLRDIADGILFEASEIDKERNVILSELRSRDGLAYRAEVASYQTFFKGLTLTDRMPIGTPQSINSLKRDKFIKFHRKWYRPDLMVLVAVGDIDALKLEVLFKEYFDTIKKPTTSLPKRNIGRLKNARSIDADAFRISHVGSANIRAASVNPTRKKSESFESKRLAYNQKFGLELLQQRLGETIPYGSKGGAGFINYFGHDAAVASIEVSGKRWEEGIRALDRVIRYTYNEGFEEKDLEFHRSRKLFRAQKLSSLYPKMDPSRICESIVKSVTDDTVFLGYDQNLLWETKFLEDLNKKSIHRSFKETWDLEHMAFHIAGEVNIKDGSDKIKKTISKGRKDPVSLSKFQFQSDFEFEPVMWGKTGVVVDTKTVPEIDAHLMRFDNNIRLNFIESHLEPGVVRVNVRIGGGFFDLDKNIPGLREFALQAFLYGGTNRYEPYQISSIINSAMINFGFDLADHDAFSFRGTTGSEDLEYFLGIITEYLHKPTIYRFSYENAIMGAVRYRMSSSIGIQDGYREFQSYLFEGDGRFAWGTRNDYTVVSVNDVRDWLEYPLNHGYIDVSIVGDITKEQVIDNMSRTLGALKDRRLEKKNTAPNREVKIIAPAGYRQLEFTGQEHQAMVVGYWPINRYLTLQDRIALQVLSGVIERRLWERLREDLGVSYSPKAEFLSYREYPEFAAIEAKIDSSPEHAPDLAQAILGISKEIAENGLSNAEVAGAIGPVKIKTRQAFRSNEFLLDFVLKRAQEKPETIKDAIAVKNDIVASVTVEKVNAFAKELLHPDNARAAAITPKPYIGLFQTDTDLP